jgi:hypothetical protein
MPSCLREAYNLASRIDSLKEPYRQNALTWLEIYTQKPIQDPTYDLLRFLNGLSPGVCEEFVAHAGTILEEAVRYFGAPHMGVGKLGQAY